MKKSVTMNLVAFALVICSCEPREPENLHAIPTLTVESKQTNGFDLSVYKKASSGKVVIGSHRDLRVRRAVGGDSLYINPKESAAKLLLLPMRVEGKRSHLVIRTKKRTARTFSYAAAQGEEKIVVMGGFNDWSRSALVMEDDDGDGIYQRTVYLRPERDEYKFMVDGNEIIDPANPDSVSNNLGGWNSVLDLSHLKEQPAGKFIKVRVHANRLIFRFLKPDDGVMPADVFVLFDNTRMPSQRIGLKRDGTLTVDVTNLQRGLIRITGLDGKGRVIPENHTILREGQPLDPFRSPGDWHFAVLYSLMVDRLLDGNPTNTVRMNDPDIRPIADFHGGDLAGIIKKLEEGYFMDLGISAIWITPVGLVPEKGYVESIPPNRKYTGYHGYWPIAARTVDPRFGTEEELKGLVKMAHDQRINVILDLVSNHAHEEHPYFSDHRDWFGSMYLPDGEVNIRNWSKETRLTTWFDSFIPSYDFVGSERAVDQVVEDALWWLETFDLDGFRQDAVKHVPHGFWRKLTHEMKRRFPEKDFYQIGETFGSDELIKSYVNPGELSSQFNFAIYFNARGPFSANEADFSRLAKVISDNLEVYGPVHLMGNITSSHDQVRFMAFADEQVRFDENGTERAFDNPPGPVQYATSYAKLANFTAFNLALPGVPVIYYGEEVGLMGAGDPDNRRPMRFGSELTEAQANLLIEISKLTKLRRQHPSIPLGDFVPLLFDGPIMVFAKIYFEEAVLVAINNGPSKRDITVHLPFTSERLVNLLATGIISLVDDSAHLTLESYSHAFYELK